MGPGSGSRRQPIPGTNQVEAELISLTEPSRVEDFETTVGAARVHFYDVLRGVPRASLVLCHGNLRGVDSWDLQILAAQLPRIGVDVALVEQPWQVSHDHATRSEPHSDAAFREVVMDLRRSGSGLRRLVVGGRGTGARVACRTAADVRADAVLNLAFPLHRSGRATPDHAEELAMAARACPVTTLQGEFDAHGRPVEISQAAVGLGTRVLVVSVPWCDHVFRVPKRATVTLEEVSMIMIDSAKRALLYRTGNDGPLLARW